MVEEEAEEEADEDGKQVEEATRLTGVIEFCRITFGVWLLIVNAWLIKPLVFVVLAALVVEDDDVLELVGLLELLLLSSLNET